MHSLRAWFSRHLIALALVWAVFSIAAALIIAADGLLRPDLSGDAPPAAALPAEPVQSPQLTQKQAPLPASPPLHALPPEAPQPMAPKPPAVDLPSPPQSVAPDLTKPSPYRTVDQALEQLKTANVAFNTPDTARVGKQFIIEAKLSTKLNQPEMKVLIEEAGKVEVAKLKVSDRMVATLLGGSAFDVSPTGPQEQWISNEETTDWHWEVTPKTVGEQFLILSFDAVISINGKEDKRTLNTFKRHINVDVGWPETAGEWLELVKKTGENLSWIWVTLLFPVGGGMWAALKRLRRRTAKQQSADRDLASSPYNT